MFKTAIAALMATAALSGCHTKTDPTPSQVPEESKQAAQSHCIEPRPVVDVGNWPLTFVPNVGQDRSDVRFQGLGLQAATLSFVPEGVRLALAPTGGARPTAGAVLTLRHLEAQGDIEATTGSELPGTSTWHFSNQRRVRAPQYERLERKLVPGIQASYGGTSRLLEVTYTVAPGASPSQLRWSYGDETGLRHVSQVGSVELDLGGTTQPRSVSLGPPEAWQDVGGRRKEVEARYEVKDGVVSVVFGDYSSQAPLQVRTRLLHSPYIREYRAARVDGRTLVTGTAWQASPSLGDSGRDAFVAALDEASGRLAFAAYFVGLGDDEGEDVAVSRTGEVLVAGATRSDDFPTTPAAAQPTRKAGTDGFVAVLSANGRELVGATYLGGAGDDRVTGVVASDDGAVRITGVMDDESLPVVAPERTTFTTVLPHFESSPTVSHYFLTELEPRVRSLTSQVVFVGPSELEPGVSIDCSGELLVGISAWTSSVDCNTWPDLVYTMRQYGANYVQDHDFSAPPSQGLGSPPGGWGYHALRWRYHDANDPASPMSYPPGATVNWAGATAPGPVIPKSFFPDSARAADLGVLENSMAVFTSGNPPGDWVWGSSSTVEELALQSAMAKQWFGTPVYTTRDDLAPNGQWYSYPMAIERVKYNVCVDTAGTSYTGQGLETLCNIPPGWVSSNSCNPAAIGGTGFYITVSSFEAATWNRSQTWFLEHVWHVPYPQFWYDEWYHAGEWVADPPDDEPYAVARLDEAAAQLSGFTMRSLDVVRTSYVAGSAVGSSNDTVRVRTRDLR